MYVITPLMIANIWQDKNMEVGKLNVIMSNTVTNLLARLPLQPCCFCARTLTIILIQTFNLSHTVCIVQCRGKLIGCDVKGRDSFVVLIKVMLAVYFSQLNINSLAKQKV